MKRVPAVKKNDVVLKVSFRVVSQEAYLNTTGAIDCPGLQRHYECPKFWVNKVPDFGFYGMKQEGVSSLKAV